MVLANRFGEKERECCKEDRATDGGIRASECMGRGRSRAVKRGGRRGEIMEVLL